MYIDSNGKKWFKGNLHTHTKNSDGRLMPEDAIALYESNGYDFLALTEHWKVSPNGYTEGGMLLLSGIEYNFNGGDVLKGVFHILGIGMNEEPQLDRNSPACDAQPVIDMIHGHGGLAVLAHPAWSMNTAEQMLSLRDYDCTEIFNSVSDFPHNCRPYSGEVIDQLAARGRFVPCIADDDSHFYDGEQCRSYIYVQADELSKDAILDGIRAGRFYATQGPILEYSVEDNAEEHIRTVHLTLRKEDNVVNVVRFSGLVWAGGRCVTGEALETVDLPVKQNEGFIRPEIYTADGKRAWLSPIPCMD